MAKKRNKAMKKTVRNARKEVRAPISKNSVQKKSGPAKSGISDKTILIILDGWGIRKSRRFNAIKAGKTPNLTRLEKNYPHAALDASGNAVGLPKGQMGNSEVGHMTIGAGRIVEQEYMMINKEIRKGSFFRNKEIIEAFRKG